MGSQAQNSQHALPTHPTPSHPSTGSCPNDCSGNGLCLTLNKLPTSVGYSAAQWDANRIQACECDAGYFGTDCSQRVCPTGDDPLTQCPTTLMGGAIQEIKITLGSRLNLQALDVSGSGESQIGQTDEGMSLFGTSDTATVTTVVQLPTPAAQIRVGALDAYNNSRYSDTAASAIFSLDAGGYGLGDKSLKVALENTPTLKSVSVSSAFAKVTGTNNIGGPYGAHVILEKRYLVTFVPDYVSSVSVGVQNPLLCSSGYGCTGAGCSPMVNMPFLYRYAASGFASEYLAYQGTFFTFYTGTFNSVANFNTAKEFLRLDSTSSPRLPLGMSPDATLSSDTPGGRYDARVIVAVQDTKAYPGDDPVDVFWTRVVYGHGNITAESYEYTSGSGFSGPWAATSATSFSPSLLGFTYQGLIPSTPGSSSTTGNPTFKAIINEAPGVVIEFPSRSMVSQDTLFKFFEILVKLPSCAVTTLATGSEFLSVNGTALAPVDSRVENVECSNRGQCNRASGMCECFSGFYGVSCSRQTTMV